MAISPPRVALSVRPRDPTPIWRLLRLCIFVTIGLSVAGIVANVYEMLITSYDQDTPLMQLWYYWYDYGGYALWLIFFLTFFVLLWLTYRLARNLHALKANTFTLSPSYAVGCYFVPIANLFMPPRVTGLIARDTFSGATAANTFNALIGWWWGLFLLAALLSNAAAIFAARSGVYDLAAVFDGAAYEIWLWSGAIAWIVNIASCVFMLRVFAALSLKQRDLIGAWEARSNESASG